MNRLMAENWRIRGARAAAGADPRGPAWSALPGLPGLGELGRDGLPGAFFGDQQPAGQVDGHAGAAENGEDGEDDPHGRDVHVEVAGDAGGDSREHPVLDRPAQWLPVVRAGLGAGGGGSAGCWICSGCVHVFSVLPRARPVDREDPRFDPDGPLAGSGLARIAGQAASRDDGHMEEGSGAAQRGRPASGRDGRWPSWPAGRRQPRDRWPGRGRFRPPEPGRWGRGARSGGPLRRARQDRLAGGVAAGLAARTGFGVTAVRTVFVLAALASGFGAAAYVVAWLMVPAVGENSNIASKAMTDRRGIALVVAAIVVVLGPWWLRIARDLVAERQARIRAEERADMAVRVHDSVLQTLALIQRRAAEPQQVIQLARAQERELRNWLFGGRAPGSMAGQGMTLAAGVRLIQQEVEAQHGVAVDAVTVGDCPLDDDLAALLAAGREATVNAVKWSGADVVSLFAEVEPAQVSLFVRDRGRGFDPAAVPDDRKGLAESVHARMARRGGSAAVRSVHGEGTEVSLTMPRRAGKRQPSRA